MSLFQKALDSLGGGALPEVGHFGQVLRFGSLAQFPVQIPGWRCNLTSRPPAPASAPFPPQWTVSLHTVSQNKPSLSCVVSVPPPGILSQEEETSLRRAEHSSYDI